MLKPSSRDMVSFSLELRRRLKSTIALYSRRHLVWKEPEHIAKHLPQVKAVWDRYDQGDFRHSDSEQDCISELALFTIAQFRKAHGHQRAITRDWPARF